MKTEIPSRERLARLAADLGMELSEQELSCYLRYFEANLAAIEHLDRRADFLPEVKYPREAGYRPTGADNPCNAWAVKTAIRGRRRGKLAGKTVAIKDAVAVAGVPMSDGASTLQGYVPEFDATIVTRILDAGGEIAGKAACEYFCYSSGSHTSVTGPVENPVKPGHTTGGSSSGSAALVACGAVDMAIGTDAAGSVRIPSSHCGLYGMKPTWGLVPYTGILSSEHNIDHTGPITRTVADNALLLEVLAGDDGIDLRRAARRPKLGRYTRAGTKDLKGLRIGVVREGFGGRNATPEVDEGVRRAAGRWRGLGATLEEISIPWHAEGVLVWLTFALEGYHANMMLGNGFGTNHGGLYWTSLNDFHANWRARADELPPNLKIGMLLGEYARQEYRGHFYVKAMNQALAMTRAYDEALERFDVLLMPTVPRKAVPLPGPDATLEERIDLAWENVDNTSPFNLSHHPAMSLPCGLAAACPIGMMLIGRHYDEMTLYRAAFAWEREIDWRSL
jgi:amidase